MVVFKAVLDNYKSKISSQSYAVNNQALRVCFCFAFEELCNGYLGMCACAAVFFLTNQAPPLTTAKANRGLYGSCFPAITISNNLYCEFCLLCGLFPNFCDWQTPKQSSFLAALFIRPPLIDKCTLNI